VRVTGLVGDAHAALAQFFGDLIVTECRADHGSLPSLLISQSGLLQQLGKVDAIIAPNSSLRHSGIRVSVWNQSLVGVYLEGVGALGRSAQVSAALRRTHVQGRQFFPVGQRRFSSSNQFWTRIISVTGSGFLSSSFIIRNRWPSREMSHPHG